MVLRSALLLIMLESISLLSWSQENKINAAQQGAETDSSEKGNNKPQFDNMISLSKLKDYGLIIKSNSLNEMIAPALWKRKDWIKAGVFILGEGAMAMADKPVEAFILQLRNDWRLNKVTRYISGSEGGHIYYIMAATGIYGLIGKNEKLVSTSLLATQALITGNIAASFMKFLTGRSGPLVYNTVTLRPEKKFKGPFSNYQVDIYGNKCHSSFPSVNSTTIFALATVFASEYKNIRIVPIIAYGTGFLIGINELLTNKHWVTDIIAGEILGYFTGKLILSNNNTLSHLKTGLKRLSNIQVKLNYGYTGITPGIIYSF